MFDYQPETHTPRTKRTTHNTLYSSVYDKTLENGGTAPPSSHTMKKARIHNGKNSSLAQHRITGFSSKYPHEGVYSELADAVLGHQISPEIESEIKKAGFQFIDYLLERGDIPDSDVDNVELAILRK